jgi:hypothetical protein
MTSPHPVSLNALADLLEEARRIGTAYYRLTGKPLGITGEVGEYEVARIMGLTLLDARSPGYDAIGADGRRVQIKARMFAPGRALGGQRLGRIKSASEFDTVMLVMLDTDYQPWVIWEAQRTAVLDALAAPGSRSRNERGALSISKFRSLSQEVWRRAPVTISD